MPERFSDRRFGRLHQSRLATLHRMAARAERRLAAGYPGQEHYLRAELSAVKWATKVLLSDHSLPLGEVIRRTANG